MHKNKSKVKESNKHLIRIKTNLILIGMIMKSSKQLFLKEWKRKIRISLLKLRVNKLNLFQVHILQKVCRKKLYLLQRRNKFYNSVIFVETIFLHLRWPNILKLVLDKRKDQVQLNQVWTKIMMKLIFVEICKV